MAKQIISGAAGALIATLVLVVVTWVTDWFTTHAGADVPEGAVVSFELESCPKEFGWYEYTQAQGMFIRGHDPKGERKLGTPQEDAIRRHHHIYQGGGPAGTTTADRGGEREGLWHDGDSEQDDKRPTSDVGADETRPANISLLYCVKRGRNSN